MHPAHSLFSCCYLTQTLALFLQPYLNALFPISPIVPTHLVVTTAVCFLKMGFYDPEASLPNRVSQAMNFGYRVNDTRRRLFFLTVSTLFILLLIVSGTRHAPVRGWIDQHRIRVQASWTSTATSSPLDPTYLYSDPGSPSSSDQGPVLGNGERKLSKQSLKQLRNSTLGVGSSPHWLGEKLTDECLV